MSTKTLSLLVALALLVAFGARALSAPDDPPSGKDTVPWAPREGKELLDQPAPAWAEDKTWINSPPLTLEGLRGKVVLIRFWLVGCPYCTASAPALNTLHERYAERGLVVIGFHHPKSRRSDDLDVVRREAEKLGFEFPLAHDGDWEALRKYWFPTDERRRFTSVSFLLDRTGTIRWLHDGGEYHEGDDPDHARCLAALRSLNRKIETLLAEDEKPGSE